MGPIDKDVMSSHRLIRISGAILMGAALLPDTVGHAQRRVIDRTPLVDSTRLRMSPEQALTNPVTIILGDPAKPGLYVIRARFAPGQSSRPHYHDQERHVTVLKGTWWAGEGDFFQADKMVPLKAGGFMLQPAGLHHFDGARDEEVILQISGIGPVKTVASEVDERGQPVMRIPPVSIPR